MQIRKTFIAFLVVMLFVLRNAMAQSVGGSSLPPMKPIEKTVYDSASVKVYYEYSYRPDSMSSARIDGQTVLLVGEKAQGFADYYDLRMDFLNDSIYQAHGSAMECFTSSISLNRSKAYRYPVVIDYNRNLAIVQANGVNVYQYTQPVPKIDWQLVEADTTICNVPCKKAMCRFGGRDWTAWYSPQFGLGAGPYLFGGLPGLIFAVYDSKDNYRFTLNGLENLKVLEPIYLKNIRNTVHSSREKVRKALANEFEDIYKAFEMKAPGTVFESRNSADSGKRPYNPIELQ